MVVRLALVGDIDVTFHITIVTDPEVSSSGYCHRTPCWTEVMGFRGGVSSDRLEGIGVVDS